MGEGLYADTFKELYDLFRKAELALKEVEELEKELNVPSLNQLRYAGKHLLDFLGGKDAQNEEELQKAKRHIQRAIYDAYEAGILGILEYIDKFHNRYGALPKLREQISEYDDFMDQADAANDLIDKARIAYDSREIFYDQCQPHLKKMYVFQRRLKRIEPVLGEILRQKKVKFWHYVIGVSGAVIGAIITYGISLLVAFKSSK